MASEQATERASRLAWDVAFVDTPPDVHPPGGLSQEEIQAFIDGLGLCETHVLVAADRPQVLQIFQACTAE